tara:strand:+ start:9055 stop:9687 length:633 start_codon:yes stop_codon:yes gene_type:complete
LEKDRIIVLGGGGHAKALIDVIKMNNEYEIEGILDNALDVDIRVMGVSVIGKDDMLAKLRQSGVVKACLGVGSAKNNSLRKKLYEKTKELGFSFPSLINKNTIVADSANISEGSQIMAGAIIQPDCVVGQNTIINTGAIVEHDCNIGMHVHICPGVTISGGCSIGDSSFIGAGSTIIHGINVGKEAVVGAGSIVIKDVADGKTAIGVPAK